MLLTTALQNRVIALGDAEKTYKEHVCTVNQTVTAVISSQLPVLNPPPPDWQAFTDAYVKANAEALTWTNQVMGRLLSVPKDVRTYNDTIVLALADAQSQTAALIANPSDAVALSVLHHDLDTVKSQLDLVVTFVSGAVDSIRSFQNTLPDLAAQLHTIATKSTADASADQAKIDQLRADVKALQDDISALTAAIVALGIADVAAISLATFATIAAWPFGAVVWLFAAPAIAVATTCIALDGIKIKADQDKIASDQTQITDLTAQVATLHLLADQMSTLASQTEGLTVDLQAILAEWQTLQSEVNQAIADIRAAAVQADAKAFQAVSDDLNQAVTLWTQAYAQAGALQLDLKVNTGNVQLGMSSQQVQAAVAAGTQVDLITYLNHVGQVQGISQRTLTH